MRYYKKLTDDLVQAWALTLIQEYEKARDEVTAIATLELPNFSINDELTRTLGAWDNEKRTITLSQQLFLLGAWDDVVAVLKHEMAHQIVAEIFGIRNEEPHGYTFKRACGLLNIPAGACYTLSNIESGSSSNLLKKIEKLLALGQSSNTHEAERALLKAHELSLKHNIALNDSHNRSRYALRLVGPLSKRTPSYMWKLMNILQDFYFVKYIRRPCHSSSCQANGRAYKIIELYGTLENLDMAEYVYYFLLYHGQQEWQRYRHKQNLVNDKLKLSFLNGIYDGYRNKLAREKHILAKEKALIWLGDVQLDHFYRQRNPRIRSVSMNSKIHESTHHAGLRSGEKLIIRPAIKSERNPKSNARKLLEPPIKG